MLDKQGAQLLAVAILVLSRTWISDRIASLNGISIILLILPCLLVLSIRITHITF